MWTRKALKTQAKEALKRNYWKIVLVSLLLLVVSSWMPALSASGNTNNSSGRYSEEASDKTSGTVKLAERVTRSAAENFSDKYDPVILIAFVVVFVTLAMFTFGIAMLLDVFLVNPVVVGVRRFMAISLGHKAKISEVAYAFDHHYKNVIWTMFMVELRVFLWALLFIIPGIYKKFEYYMVGYILSERPDMPYKEALEYSRRMMKGQKWNAFVLELSFILWDMLGVMTCGIVGVFYVRPYKELTKAALYLTLRQRF